MTTTFLIFKEKLQRKVQNDENFTEIEIMYKI